MISNQEAVRISKFLSRVLRHQPEITGIELDKNGWTDIDLLLQQMNTKGFKMNRSILQYIVDTNTKKRFAINEAGSKIRAAQGHSVTIQLDYEEAVPPFRLYHGTAQQNVAAILKEGLKKQKRHSVHLSSDKETALKVGQRHGKPVLLQVAAQEMHVSGFIFYLSSNGVWLTDHVPSSYILPLQ